jgi:plasmid stabilization system protein ParE
MKLLVSEVAERRIIDEKAFLVARGGENLYRKFRQDLRKSFQRIKEFPELCEVFRKVIE